MTNNRTKLTYSNNDNIIVVGNLSDSYFAIDIADFLKQKIDFSDLIMLKTFANSEFCPRFTVHDEEDFSTIGSTLSGKTVIIVSVHRDQFSRNELAMRNFIIARAAKDNDAKQVILVEPELFYSAQDRGPKTSHGKTEFDRELADLYKFNGQPFTARLYGNLLKSAGVDIVITVHNHSVSTQYEYTSIFGENNFVNLFPDKIFNYYIHNSGMVDPSSVVLVAPDKGAADFVGCVAKANSSNFPIVIMDKIRTGERKVHMSVAQHSQYPLSYIKDQYVIVLDDMVRTGGTIVSCCKLLREYNPKKIVFISTHFHSSEETKINLSTPYIDEIITTSTIPSILNRDNQGRLRKKMAVLKINKWIASYLNKRLNLNVDLQDPLYIENISDKNPRSDAYLYA
ncbi:phosphoribosyltransferase family protein [Chondrinema litorale]|uniref:phosphoribosyltransferase family protein n=1 Tax=Chondrinema litorale TaxID=2994555 RepID=UPI002542783D|nr:phosphoribosyltransferase family protein [Chondrinema litorale]UZS00100.1 phosphoribosyltransferase family protein [Chondrinema litorale]